MGKTEVPILQADETVELAFKCGRDMFLLTNKRVIEIDVQGVTGSKVQYFTKPFKYIKAFSVQTGGIMSWSVKATLFVSQSFGCSVTTKFSKNSISIFEINNVVGNKVLNKKMSSQNPYPP